MVAHGGTSQGYSPYVATIAPAAPQQQWQQPSNAPQYNRQERKTPQFDPIPMKYADLLPALLEKNLVQTKPPPPVRDPLPSWYRPDKSCAFHQGAPGHDTEHCISLKYAVQRLIQANLLSFKDSNPNVQTNPLPNHSTPSINMIQGYHGTHRVLKVQHIPTSLVTIHTGL